jgi:sensor histidine kinase YesM
MIRPPRIPARTSTLFWRFQIIGWICFVAVYSLTFQPDFYKSWDHFKPVPVNLALGMAVTLAMRWWYLRLHARKIAQTTLTLVMLGTAIVGAVLWMSSDYSVSVLLWGRHHDFPSWRNILFVIMTDTATLFGWSLLYFALKLWMDWNEEKKRSETAVKLAREAQLQLLRYQLNPHFLFNSLNSIRTLVDENPETAKHTITELAEFFRYSLANRDVLYVPLREEFDAMRHYFAIQRIRYEDRLQVEIDVTPEAEAFPVLSFLVQPLVENAVKYGMQTSAMPLQIRINAQVVDSALKLDIFNSGAWVDSPPAARLGTGTGLDNVRRVLHNAYPDSHRFEVGPADGGVRAELWIYPLSEQP